MQKYVFFKSLYISVVVISLLMLSSQSFAAICDNISEAVIEVDVFAPDKTGQLDASPQIQEALDCFKSKIINGAKSGSIEFSPGIYRLDQQVSFIGSSDTSDDFENLVISGVGTQAVTFNVNNTSGGILIDVSNYRTGTVELRNLKFLSLKEGGGTAIEVSQPAGGGQHRRNFIAKDIEIYVNDITSNYFNYGIKLNGSWRPLIDNVLMSGPFGPNSINEFAASACFELTDTYSPTIINSRCWSADRGLNLIGTSAGNPEGITILSSKFVETNIGVNIQTVGYEPEAFISKNHINSRIRGIIFNRRTKAIIDGNLMYNNYADHSFYQDILIFDSQDVIITNNTFFNPKTVSHASRTAIRVANNSKRIIISDNIFRSEGVGVSIGTGVDGTRIINNHFYDTSTNIINSGVNTLTSANY